MNTDGICEFLSAFQAQIGHFADIAQLGERQTEDLKVPGSIPGVGSEIILRRVIIFWSQAKCHCAKCFRSGSSVGRAWV